MELNDVEIFFDGDNQLTIQGERKTPAPDAGTWHRRERGFGQFKRTISLPVSVASDDVSATLKNGILTIQLPKPEELKPRKIAVKSV
jgi:HSP20 family protein